MTAFYIIFLSIIVNISLNPMGEGWFRFITIALLGGLRLYLVVKLGYEVHKSMYEEE